MIETAIQKLDVICKNAPDMFSRISHEQWETKPSPDKWSKKQILGHLIDSATNNHHRFVRSQFERSPAISYDQNLWNKHNYYQEIEPDQLIKFWTLYNIQLLELVKRIPESLFQNKLKMGENEYSLAFVFQDYVAHLKHHLNQILDQ